MNIIFPHLGANLQKHQKLELSFANYLLCKESRAMTERSSASVRLCACNHISHLNDEHELELSFVFEFKSLLHHFGVKSHRSEVQPSVRLSRTAIKELATHDHVKLMSHK